MKLLELRKIVEEIELKNADISSINDVVLKVKNRIDDVVEDTHPEDDKEVLEKLKQVSSQLGSVLSTLSDIQRSAGK